MLDARHPAAEPSPLTDALLTLVAKPHAQVKGPPPASRSASAAAPLNAPPDDVPTIPSSAEAPAGGEARAATAARRSLSPRSSSSPTPVLERKRLRLTTEPGEPEPIFVSSASSGGGSPVLADLERMRARALHTGCGSSSKLPPWVSWRKGAMDWRLT